MRVVELTEDLSTAPATQLQISHNRCAHAVAEPYAPCKTLAHR